jgi:outer membrane protein TolC
VLLLLAVPVGSAAAQTTTLAPPPTPTQRLTLREALQQARTGSPTLRQALNNVAPARTSVRNAYASFLPTLGASGNVGYTGSGQSQFGAFFARTSPFITSGFSIGFSWTFDGRTLAAPAQARANLAAADADATAAQVTLEADVTTQYLATLQAAAQVEVNRTQVQRNTDFLALAQARYRVGQANLLDVRQAEVARGTSEVTLLQSEQRLNEAKLELYRRMGQEPPAALGDIALADSFPVLEPTWKRADLIALALDANPQLGSLRSRERAADASVRAARSEYLPSVTASAGWSGFTQQFTDQNVLLQNATAGALGEFRQCPFTNNAINLGVAPGPLRDCAPANFGLDPSGTALTADAAAAVRNANRVFPFDFRAQPFSAQLTVRLPLWDNFSRDVRISQARAQALNAEEQTRARSLQLQSEVASRLLAVETAYRTVGVQARNRDAARDQLQLAQDRYRIGSGSSLEVTDAQAATARAEGEYVNAVYNYHIALTALEQAVGRSLR